MKNTIKAGIGLSALAVTNVTLAAGNIKFTNGSEDSIRTSERTFPQLVTDWITSLSLFLGLVAVCYGLWWGFNILTAGGDEEKVKTGKAIITRAALWLVAIFLVSVIVNTVIKFLFGGLN